jgi:HD-like signal output (HDOD) protein
LKLVENPDANLKELEKAVESDSALTAKILKVANSPFYGGASVATASRAISVIGMSAMRTLVVSLSYRQMIGNATTTEAFDKLEYWKHSLATATAAKVLAKLKVPAKAEEVYVAGMMHDVGMLVLDRFMPMAFDQVITMARDTGVPLHLAEQEEWEWDHATVGALLAERWGISKMVRHAIEFHHCPEDDGDYYDTTVLVSAADVLAHQAGMTNNQPGLDAQMPPPIAAHLALPDEQYAAIREVVTQEVERAQALFGME